MLFAFAQSNFSCRSRNIKITELIIAFHLRWGRGCERARAKSSQKAFFFVCALRLPYLISNMKQPSEPWTGKEESRNVHITGSILMINGLLHFFFFSSKKSYFAYKNTRNQLVCKKRRKMLRDSRLARPFLPSFASWFSVRCSPFFSSPHRRVLNFINLSSTGLCINSRCWRKKNDEFANLINYG